MADDLTMLAEIAKARAERAAAIGEDLDAMLGEAEYWLTQALEHARGKAVHGLAVVDAPLAVAGDRLEYQRSLLQETRTALRARRAEEASHGR